MRSLNAFAVATVPLLFGAIAHCAPVNLTRASGTNTYFNRPGADLATHDRELGECLALASRAQQPDTAFSASMIVNMILVEEQRTKTAQALGANAENCMVARGWRVVELPAEEADAIGKLGQIDQAARLKDWVGADPVHGVVLRQWTGELGGPGTIKFKSGSSSGRPSLSYSARDWSHDPPLPKPNPRSAWDDHALPARSLAAAEVPTARSDEAVVILRITGASLANGDNLVFQRLADASREPASDKRPDVVRAYDNPFWEKAGKWFAFAVPAGRWRIESMGGGKQIFELNFCLGSPAFNAGAGEVIYAGTFDLDAADIGPDLSLAPVKLWLGPAGGIADRVKPATYLNGSRVDCGGTYIDALEIKGATYQESSPGRRE
jgi:hypothetical protein